ncbi:MAG: hypothetical protein QM784_35820 [Polyangiaceae bacterium]
MKTLLRSFWFATIAVVYVAFASLEANSQQNVTWLLLVGAPFVLWLTWRYTGASPDVLEPERLVLSDAKRAAVTGTLLYFCARTGPLGHPGFDAAANVGVGITLVSACIALSKISGRGGLLSAPRATQSLDAATMAAMLWGLATTLPAIRTMEPDSVLALDPIALDYATVTAAMASLLLLLATTARLSHLRRLELDVADRATSALVVAFVALLATVPALLLDVIAPDRAVPTVVVLSSLFHIWASSTADARRVTSFLRGSLAIAAFLAPSVLLLAILARNAPSYAPLLIVATATVSVILGLLAARLSRPLAPEQARWIDALELAAEAALVPDPDDALRATLVALAPTAPGPSARVELWRLDPPTSIYVDVAGQLHEEAALVPNSVIALAEREPERTLRTDVLSSVQVRNPTAREALAYLEPRHVFAATLLTSETCPLGMLALPRTHRKSQLSLEECTAMRKLCDRLESVLSITSAQARSREREQAALTRVGALETENLRLSTVLTSAGNRHKRFVERFAQKLRPQLYSPNGRITRQRIEQIAKTDRVLSLVLPPGADALGWASLFHLESDRHLGPFVAFDGGSSDFDQELWDDPERSPFAIAQTGTWVLVNPQALSQDQQEKLVSALVRWKATQIIESAAPMGFVLAVHMARGQNFDELPIAESLKSVFPVATRVDVPPLAERPEDLRAAVFERVARLGMVLRGRALGVAPAVLADLLEYEWPLNDLELEKTLSSLVLVSESELVTAADLERIGFPPPVAPTGRVSDPDDGDTLGAASVLPRRRPRISTRTQRSKER